MVREYISSTGVLIKVGENAKENDILVKSSHQDFVWCHLENQPSPHAVIEDASPDTQTIDEALQLVKYYSKARNCPQSRMITCKIRELARVDRARPGLVQLKRAPTKKSIRTDPPALRRLGIACGR
jgi:predicted ribosome quality control (RQC) complex YloA/Tae2 family protein